MFMSITIITSDVHFLLLLLFLYGREYIVLAKTAFGSWYYLRCLQLLKTNLYVNSGIQPISL